MCLFQKFTLINLHVFFNYACEIFVRKIEEKVTAFSDKWKRKNNFL